MARTKARWHGKLLRNMFRDGGSVVLLGRLENDPDRITEFRVNRSNAVPFALAVLKEAEPTQEELTGMVDSLGKMIGPQKSEPTNGRHAVDEF